ncbi:MAG: 2-amino-4-hydroxy-6-hydroxymethyldihydropteridine diphosphokinase [Myxococcales bacterium]|nr:2-amino-4-hydroxy-6-hydroxymethyldihydropteridine diphosphokinase [Myxococcales bacterium]MCB9750460.1 2-amino-4-hydroxy-6-hydroxymethyldihydropteridine diphosphokinase [Myxococcales bacterium]
MTRPAPLELDAKPEVAAAPIAAPALAYVGIGGNLGDRATILGSAVDVFARGWIPGTRLLRCSPAFETRPLGPSRFPFLNAALELATTLTPIELLDALLTIERSHGRTRRASSRWGARTLDLDLLVYLPHATAREDDAVPVAAGSLTVSTPRLRLPHPELARRDFVLTPLACLDPELRPSGEATVEELLVRLPASARTILTRWPSPLGSSPGLAASLEEPRPAHVAGASPLPVAELVAPQRGVDALDDSG